jgi:hypothetical protein
VGALEGIFLVAGDLLGVLDGLWVRAEDGNLDGKVDDGLMTLAVGRRDGAVVVSEHDCRQKLLASQTAPGLQHFDDDALLLLLQP